MTGEEELTRREQLLYLASLEFEDESIVFTGFHWPIAAARVARRLHAPDLIQVFEAGIVYRGEADKIPTSTTELGAFEGQVDMYSDSMDALQTILKSGDLDNAVVDAANVDRFGNVNSSVIGEYDNPSVRLPGPGGSKDILSYFPGVTLICGSEDPQRFQDRVSYVSSPGHLNDNGTKEGAGFEPKTGPDRLLTPFGRFGYDEAGHLYLDGLINEVTLREVREITGWEITDNGYDRLPAPSQDELTVVRNVMAEAQSRGYRSIKP
jgi:acyl CoA:acetate/3-ketoacid CoA transferase beta subunit